MFAALEAGGHEGRAVGGTVRNALMGLAVSDTDIATTAPPEETMRLARAAGLHAHPTGLQHGTVTLVAHGVPIEVTTLRRDVETFGRHATVAFTDDWVEDARRRDFTMNALYCDRGGSIHDPLGGYPDVPARRVRFIGAPHDRIREDYLRILRFFRFHATYGRGSLDGEGLAASAELKEGMRQLSAERIRAELVKLVVAPGAHAALAAMTETGIWQVLLDVPPDLARFDRLKGIEVALRLPPDPILHLGALTLSDRTAPDAMALRLRLSGVESQRLAVAAAAMASGRTITPDIREAAQREALYRLGPDAFTATVLMNWAQMGAAPDAPGWRALAQLPERWTAPRLPVKGADVLALGVAPGPRVGEILAAFEGWWITEGFPADPVQVRSALSRLVSVHKGLTSWQG